MPKFPFPALLGKSVSTLEREVAEAAAREATEAGAREAELLGREAFPSTELRPARLSDDAVDASFRSVDDAASMAPELESAINGGSNGLKNGIRLGGAGLIGAGLYDMATRQPEPSALNLTPKAPAGMAPQEIPELDPVSEPKADAYASLMKRVKSDDGLRARLEKIAFGDIKRPEIKQMAMPEKVSLDVGGETFGGAEDLKRSHDNQNLLTSFANANDGVSKGLSQAFRTQVGNSGDGLRADAKVVGAQFKQKQDNQDKDPNSSVSQMMRQQARNLGLANVSDNLTAEQIGRVLPQLKDQMNKHQEIEKFNIDSQNKMGERQYESDSRRADRAMGGLSLLDRRAEAQVSNKEKAETKSVEKAQGEVRKLSQKLSSGIASGRTTFGIAARKLQAVQAADALLNGRDPNTLDDREIAELAKVLDTTLSSGQSTVAGMKKLLPKTASQDLALFKEYLTGKRQPVNGGSFVNQFMKSLHTEGALAAKQVKETQQEVLGGTGSLKKLAPEEYEDMLRSKGLDEKSLADVEAKAPFVPKKTVAKAGYNASTGETQVVYTDGTKEITKKKVDGVDYSRYNR